jgi:hypothetical protein
MLKKKINIEGMRYYEFCIYFSTKPFFYELYIPFSLINVNYFKTYIFFIEWLLNLMTKKQCNLQNTNNINLQWLLVNRHGL